MAVPPLALDGSGPRVQQIYNVLREAILSGQLEPGERLVEETLASSANISRTPVREALNRLAAEGLVESVRRGAIVRALSANDLAELCAVREALEGLATRLAASLRTEQETKWIEQLFADYEAATNAADVPRLIGLNRDFHTFIWEMSRNGYLIRQLTTLRGQIESLQHSTLTLEYRRRETLDEHRKIVAAIVAGNPEAAEEAAREHQRQAEATRVLLRRQAGNRSLAGQEFTPAATAFNK